MKHLYLVFTLAFACLITDAQTLYPRIGITASANTYHPSNYNIKPKVDFMLGIGYNLTLSELISVQAELDYVQGMINLNDDSDSQNRCFQFSLATPIHL